MKKILALVLVATMLLLSFAACGNKPAVTTDNGTTANGGEVVEPAAATSIAVCLASEPDTIDPALNSSVDGATLVAHLFSGLAKWAQKDDGTLEIVADAAKELTEGVTNADGTVTYTYTLRDGLKWSAGKDVTAGDFVFSWNRAASTALAADYAYMYEVVDGYADIWETDADGNFVNPDAKLNVTAPDDKTLVVTLNNSVAYWNELLAFPV